MDDTLKQRLVGALVLLSVAVIFLPLVFDGREEQDVYNDIQIPEEPVVTLDVKEPEIDSAHFDAVKNQIEADRAASQTSQEHSDQPVEASPEPIAPEIAAEQEIAAIKEAVKEPLAERPRADKLSETYTIQLAAFSSYANAEKLHKQLLEKKYAAYVEKGKSANKIVYRVFVGPQLRKNRATIIAEALYKEFQLKGMVVRYSP